MICPKKKTLPNKLKEKTKTIKKKEKTNLHFIDGRGEASKQDSMAVALLTPFGFL